MPLFHYKATNSQSEIVEGDAEFPGKFDLAHQLKTQGLEVFSAEEKKKGLHISLNMSFFGTVSQHDKITFARNLGAMISAGLPLTRALSVMERQSKGEFKKILHDLGDKIAQGKTLSDAMKEYPKVFSMLFISMVKSGEESGNLIIALQNISLQLEKTYTLTKKVRGALMYPIIILCLMIVIGVLMMIYMVPTLSATFKSLNVQLPLSTQIVIGISDILQNYFLWVFLGVIILAGAITYFVRTKRGKRVMDFTWLHVPIIADIVKQVNAARTARTLSSLITSGVDIVVALGVTKDVLQNSYYKDVLSKTESTVQKGDLISTIFTENAHLYPPFVSEMVSVGEETGKIGEMLLGVAEFYENEVDQKTKDMSSIVEPFLMIFIGLAVGFFAISIISPIYSLSSSM